MKRIALVVMITVVCLCVSGVTRGEDNPLLGKWKLNVEKSKMTPASMLPKAQSRVVEADGDSVKYSYENTTVHITGGMLEGKWFRITTTNIGLTIQSHEVEICKSQGWRGAMANTTTLGGGIGLWVADRIADAHLGRLVVGTKVLDKHQHMIHLC